MTILSEMAPQRSWAKRIKSIPAVLAKTSQPALARGYLSLDVHSRPQNPKRKIKLYLIAWLDEATRIITHGQLYSEEKSYALEECLKKTIMKFGLPEQAYADNGKIYSS